MNQITPRQDYGASRTFIPFEELPPPPLAGPAGAPWASSQEPAATKDYRIGASGADRQETNAALIVTVAANVAMSLIIITAMILDGSQAHRAIIAGGAYFLVSTITFAFVITGSFTAILNHGQLQRTERKRIDAYQELGERMLEWRMMQEIAGNPLGADRRGAPHRLSPLGDSANYVAPYQDGEQAAVEGLRWAVALYDANGQPDRRKVHGDGRLLCRMIGSKRGGGSRDSGLWLLRNGVIVRVRKGYALDMLRYPTVADVRRLL